MTALSPAEAMAPTRGAPPGQLSADWGRLVRLHRKLRTLRNGQLRWAIEAADRIAEPGFPDAAAELRALDAGLRRAEEALDALRVPAALGITRELDRLLASLRELA